METGEYRVIGELEGSLLRWMRGYFTGRQMRIIVSNIGMEGSFEWGPAGLSAGTGDVHDVHK